MNLPVKTKPKELTELQLKFLDALQNEAKGDLHLAKKLAGYSKTTNLSSIAEPLKDHIVEIARNYLANHTLKAAIKLNDILDNPNQLGAKNSIAAIKEVLDRGGVKVEDFQPTIQAENVFILPKKGSKIDYDEED